MVVLSNVLANLVSVDVIYWQHATKSFLTSTETSRQFFGEDKRRQHSTKQQQQPLFLSEKRNRVNYSVKKIILLGKKLLRIVIN